jgi:F1F0 ATPase subunit 2
MMNNELTIVTVALLSGAFAAGLVLGAFYFIALWQTVKRLPDTPRPLRLMLGSFALRMAVVMPGFYFVMGGQWERLATALMGFILMRMILTRHIGMDKAV